MEILIQLQLILKISFLYSNFEWYMHTPEGKNTKLKLSHIC